MDALIVMKKWELRTDSWGTFTAQSAGIEYSISGLSVLRYIRYGNFCTSNHVL